MILQLSLSNNLRILSINGCVLFRSLWLFGCLWINSTHASDDFFSDIDIAVESPNQSEWRSLVSIKQLASYGTASPGDYFARSEIGLNKMETSFHGELEGRLSSSVTGRIELDYFHDFVYSLNDDIHPGKEEINLFENRLELRDFYLDVDLSARWNMRIGNQVIAWGQSETLAINDLISPLNQYTLMQAELKKLRLQVPAIKISHSNESFTLDTIVSYNAGYNDIAPEGNEFDPFIQLRSLPFDIETHKASTRSEFFVRLKHNFVGGDLSVMAADANHNELSLDNTQNNIMYFTQERIQSVGMSGSYNHGLWVYKAELAHHWNKPITPTSESFAVFLQGWALRDQTLAMAGFDYVGFGDATLSFEMNYVHTSGNTDLFAVEKDEFGATSSLTWSDQNQKLTLSAYMISLLNSNGFILRANADYAFTDQFNMGVQIVNYSAQPNDSLFLYRNNDVAQLYFYFHF